MNQLEAINYVFSVLCKVLATSSEVYKSFHDDLIKIKKVDDAHCISNLLRIDIEYMSSIKDILVEHLTQPDPTTLTDFVKVCDELQKILLKLVDDNAENDIVKQENS